jgi:putative peptidoglycan lipid II flippase
VLLPAEWLVVGLSFLTGFSILIQGSIAYALLRRKIGGLREGGIVRAMFSFLLAVLPAAVLGWVIFNSMGGAAQYSWALSGVVPAITSAVVVGFVMAFSYGLLLWTIRNPELRELTSQLRRRVRNK